MKRAATHEPADAPTTPTAPIAPAKRAKAPKPPKSSKKTSTALMIVNDEGERLCAQTKRTSRAARPPSPSEDAITQAWATSNKLASHLEEQGLTRLGRVPTVDWPKLGANRTSLRDPKRGMGGGSNPSSNPGSNPSSNGHANGHSNDHSNGMDNDEDEVKKLKRRIPHIISLHSRSVDAANREASFLTFEPSLPQLGSQLVQAAVRSNSVRCSVVNKESSQGGSLQTPRINFHGITTAWASQCSSVCIALGAAKYVSEHKHNVMLTNTSASTAITPSMLVAEASEASESSESFTKLRKGRMFLMTSTSRLLPHGLSTRLHNHSFLETMKGVARDELEMGVLSSFVTQRSDSLKNLCHHIVSNTDGVNVWSSWVLLCFMLGEPRLRRLVRRSSITDLEAATARVFQNYGRAEITRRARLDANMEKKKNGRDKNAAVEPDEFDDDEAEAHDDAEGAAQEAQPQPSDADRAEAKRIVTMVASISESDQAIMAAKKKRLSPGLLGVGNDPSSSFLNYWDAVMRSCRYVYILKSLITQSKEQAAAAAAQNVSFQSRDESGSLLHHQLLMSISSESAIQSARLVSSLIVTPRTATPRLVVWRARCAPQYQTFKTHIGIARSVDDGSHTSIHACKLAPKALQPNHGHSNHSVCVWSRAVRNVTPKTELESLVPGVMEAHTHIASLNADRGHATGMSRHRVDQLRTKIQTYAKALARDGDSDVALSGVARGMIVLRCKLPVSASQVDAGEAMAEDVHKLATASKAGQSQSVSMPHQKTTSVLVDTEFTKGPEPFATPCSNLGLGLQVNETVRVLLKNRSHRGDPCRHTCAHVTPSEMAEDTPDLLNLPSTLLPIVDTSIDFLESPRGNAPLPDRCEAALRTVAVTLTVSGDSPVRLPEVLRQFSKAVHQIQCQKDAFSLRLQARSLLLAGTARASEMNDLALATTSGAVNAAIASAKRLSLNDLNLHSMCTVFQVYRTGLSNLTESFTGTPWAGVYGAGFEIGSSGGIGIRASALTADKRC